MRARTNGMWWGVAIEAPDPAALARFYSELLGWPVGHEEPGTTVLATPHERQFSGVPAGERLPASCVATGRL